jgi:hypothetical protein
LLRAIAPPQARRAGRRRDIAVGCIVNTRPDLGVDSGRSFGLFLGSFAITHEVPDGADAAAVARDVAAQTGRIKRGRLYLGAPVELGLARVWLNFSSTARRRKFYHKNHPLWGGVTNMNLDALWPDAVGGPFADYFRAVSNGPATPLVVSATTCGQEMNLGLTWRPAVFSAAEITRVRERIAVELKRLAV